MTASIAPNPPADQEQLEVPAAVSRSATLRHQFAPFGVLVVAVLLWGLVMSQSSSRMSLGVTVGIYTIIALGLSLVASTAGQLNLAQAAFAACGGYGFAIVVVQFEMPYGVGLVVAVALPTLLAYALGHFLLRLRAFYMAMGTLAVAQLIDSVIKAGRDVTHGFDGISGIPAPQIGGKVFFSITDTYWYVWVVALLCVGLVVLFLSSRAGRELTALKSDPAVGSLLGHDPAYWKRAVFALSGLLGGIGGLLLAQFSTNVTPSLYSTHFAVTLFVMLVIGGWKSVWGAPIGALFVAGLPVLFETQYSDLIFALVVIVVLVALPRGIVGLLEDGTALVARGIRRLTGSQDRSRA